MIALRWRQPPPLMTTRWRGPDGSLSAAYEANPSTPIASLIGPPGEKGDPGIPGPANTDDGFY